MGEGGRSLGGGLEGAGAVRISGGEGVVICGWRRGAQGRGE